MEARRRIRARDTDGALARLEVERPFSPLEPERSWLLAFVLAERGAGAWSRSAVAHLGEGPLHEALRAALSEDVDAGLSALARRPGGDPEGWKALAAALLHAWAGDRTAALASALRARASPLAFVRVEASLLRARLLLGADQPDVSQREAASARALSPHDTRTHEIEAEALRRLGRPAEAVALQAGALAEVPESTRHARELAELLREARDPALAAQVARMLAAVPSGRNAERLALDGLLAERAGAFAAAADLYEAALAGGAVPVPLERDLRRLCLALGRVRRAESLLVGAVPPEVVADPRNLLGPAWAEVRGAFAGVEGPDPSPEAGRRLARALVGVGGLEDALAVLERLPAPARDEALAARLRSQVAFEEAIEDCIERGYLGACRAESPASLRDALDLLASLARTHLPPDEAAAFADPTVGLREVGFIGAWLDHRTATSSPVVAHFRRYGRLLIFGQRNGQPPEAILLAAASLTRDEPIRTRGHELAHDVAIGYDRRLRSYLDARGGGLGGACLPDGIWLDVAAARLSEHVLRQYLEVDPGRARIALAAPAPPPDAREGPFALGDPAGLRERLLERYVRRRGEDPWGSFRSLRAHEAAHLVELRRHLPIGRGLGSSVRLLLESGLSPARVEMELERRAQLGAMVDGPDPDLSLAEMAGALPVKARVPEAHDGGYAAGLRAIVREVHARPDLYPQVDRTRRILPQLDRLDDAQLRRAARAALRGT